MRVWIYGRQRGDEDEIRRQLCELKESADNAGHEIVGISYDTTDDFIFRREGLKRLLASVKARNVDMVVVTRLTIISHDRRILRKVLKLMQKNHVLLKTNSIQLRYELNQMNLETPLLDNAAKCNGFLPWAV